MKTLIMTVGLPRSGKSTWARAQDFPIVSPDAIRYAIHGQRFNTLVEPYVWAIAKTMVRALFLAGHDTVILDATNTTQARRDEWKSSEWQRRYYYVDTPASECIKRAILENDDYIIPIIEAMAAKFEPLMAGERFLMEDV